MIDETLSLKTTKRRIEADDADLSGSSFTNVRLAGATFDDIDLSHARFRNVNLAGVSIDDCGIEGMSIEGVAVSDLLQTYRNSRAKAG